MRNFQTLSFLIGAFFFFLQPVVGQISWYRHFNGNIDKYPITIHLHKKDHAFAGYYYYHSQQEPIYLTGDDTSFGGRIVLRAYTGNAEGDFETFSFVVSGKALSGDWKKNETSKPLALSAREASMAGLTSFEFVFTEGFQKLKPGLEESPEANYEAASVWPSGPTINANLIKKTIREVFGEPRQKKILGSSFSAGKNNSFPNTSKIIKI